MTTFVTTSTVIGVDASSAFALPAVQAVNTNTGAVNAITATAQGVGSGVYGENSNGGGFGIAARNTSTSGTAGASIYAETTSDDGLPAIRAVHSSRGIAVYAITGYMGVYGESSFSGYGVYGYSSGTNGYAIYGWQGSGIAAGRFVKDVQITGTLSKGTGSFVIDHPLDPANKDLVHSFVESPERKNIYDGVGFADANGEIFVQLPSYFEALNREFRYLLTAVGPGAPDLHIKSELSSGAFTIGGAKPKQKVYWQITGNRHDALALATPLVVEPEKSAEDKGLYRHPLAFGKPESAGIDWKNHPSQLFAKDVSK